ncbi:protein CREG1 isoform X1 [Solenopsis invicta]|uniref:protein CREG1 isoform X1 n=1 Tax=Solenopsis invicta TaxID=13686 RepID=UPI000E33EEEA|nr:protein CREG1 isoform X1 [Solenopsis invicta]
MTSRIVSIIALCILLSDAHKLDNEVKRAYWSKIEENAEAGKIKSLYPSVEFQARSIGFDNDQADQPRRTQTLENLSPALKARCVVNQADWAAVATISTRNDVESFPVANLISIADGPVGNGTGIPYMYLTPLDYTAQDLAKDHRASLLVSLTQGNYCKDKGYDPMDPRCVRVMLTGKIKAVKNETEEHEIAKQLFFGRHPKLGNMPANHKFFFAKMEMSAIAMLDTFGGPKYISINDYFNTPSSTCQSFRSDLFRERIQRFYPNLFDN